MNSFLDNLRSNWFILVFVASLIITWTTFGNRLAAVEVSASETSVSIQAIQDIKIDIAKMQKDIEYIKERLN